MNKTYWIILLWLVNIYLGVLIYSNTTEEEYTLQDTNLKIKDEELIKVSEEKLVSFEDDIKDIILNKSVEKAKTLPYFTREDGKLELSFYHVEKTLNDVITVLQENKELQIEQMKNSARPIAGAAEDDAEGIEVEIDASEFPTYESLLEGMQYLTFTYPNGVYETVFVIESYPTTVLLTFKWVGGVLNDVSIQRS